MDLIEYIKNKFYSFIAFFMAFEMFTTGIAQEANSLVQYLMLLSTLVLAVVGAYFFRKKEKKKARGS